MGHIACRQNGNLLTGRASGLFYSNNKGRLIYSKNCKGRLIYSELARPLSFRSDSLPKPSYMWLY